MRRVLLNKQLGGRLDCDGGATPLSGDICPIDGGYFASPFYRDDAAEPAPFASGSSIVAERLRISAANAAGLRKTLLRPFAMGIAALTEGLSPDSKVVSLAWKEIGEMGEWHLIDRVIALEGRHLYCVFKDLELRYDVAQIDRGLNGRDISLCIELEISTADGDG